MGGVVEFLTADGSPVLVAAADPAPGSRLVSRGDGITRAAHTLESSLDSARAAAEAALRVFRDGALRPDSVEIEFGVKLVAETGAVLVKGSAEGHLTVKLSWSPSPSQDASDAAVAAAGAPPGTSPGDSPGTGTGGGATDPAADVS